MEIDVPPEIRMARKVHKRHGLTIPFSLENLVSEYAELLYKSIPIEGVDGVCLNLKHPKKSPTVIVNADSYRTRQRFTLAHELGHIIIPWHLGTIIDDIDASTSVNRSTNIYWIYESEANRFASELLMPFDWIYSIYSKYNNEEVIVHEICEKCEVSEAAARIRITRFWNELIHYLIPPNKIVSLYQEIGDLASVQETLMLNNNFTPSYVARHMVQYLTDKIAYCVEKDDMVVECGATHGTRDYYQAQGSKFISNPYPYFKDYSEFYNYETTTHWWNLEINFNVPEDSRGWQEILDKIAFDLVSTDEIAKFKRSINGTLSGINGTWKKKYPHRSVEEFIKEIMSRFNNLRDIHILNHPDFASFVRKRSFALYNK